MEFRDDVICYLSLSCFNCLVEGRDRKGVSRLLELLIHVIMAVIEQVVGCHLLVTVACQESLYGGLAIESKVLQLVVQEYKRTR